MAPRPRPRLGRTLRRAATALLVGAAAVMIPAAPASADIGPTPTVIQPTVGWSADWHFVSYNAWIFTMNIPNASVIGTGFDDSGVRIFHGTLTDTSPSPDLCAWLTFAEGGGAQTYVACDGTVDFSQYDETPGDYTFTFALRNSSNTWRATSAMVIPSTINNPEMRAPNNGAHWSYVTSTESSFGIVRPGATVTGLATGYDSRSASAVVNATACTTTTIKDYGTVAAKNVCPSTSDPGIGGTGIYRDFEIDNCLTIRGGTLPGTPPAQPKCVPLIVM